MNQMRSAWLPAALLCAALLAGCGSSSSTSTSSTPAASTQSSSTGTATASTPKATTPTSTAPSAGHTSSAKGLAGTVCKSSAARDALKGRLKTRIAEICDAYAKGDEAKAREVAKKACVEAVEAIHAKAALKQRAMANCKASK